MDPVKSPVSWKQQRWLVSFLLLLIAAVGVGLILYETRIGPGINGDSVHYIMGAENLLLGNGFSRWSGGGEIRPITGFPPFYSTVLACMGFIGLDLFQVARILNALLFGANIFLHSCCRFR
jgi:hypothetical protein